MTPADVHEVAAMYDSVIRQTWANPNSRGAVLEKNATVAGWERYLATRHCIVACRDSEIVGTAWVFITGDTADLGGAFVRYRREGVGAKLVEDRIKYATSRGCSKARAVVVLGNVASRGNLEKAGFRVTETSDHEWTLTRVLQPQQSC
jgi:GNAT superfamily N-acetyltransferase